MVTRSGSLATISCELRQVWKEATVTVISGAEVWLGRVTTLIFLYIYLQIRLNDGCHSNGHHLSKHNLHDHSSSGHRSNNYNSIAFFDKL